MTKARVKASKNQIPSPPESRGYWIKLIGNRRRRAFAIKALVEENPEDVKLILEGGWPEGLPEVKVPEEE
jgi:hypothetical protein